MFDCITKMVSDALPVAEAVYEAVKKLPKDEFMLLLVCVIDRWAGRREMSSEETCQILEELAQIQKDVHALIGPWEG